MTQSLKFIDSVINKGLPLNTFLYSVLLLIPDLVSIVLPGALLAAILYIYNKLIADQELPVMRAAGMSNWQLAKPAIMVASLATMILYSVNLYFIPRAFHDLREIENQIRASLPVAMLQVGDFNTLKGLTIYVNSRSGPKDLRGILIYDNREPQNPFLVTAEAGSVIETTQGMRLILVKGVRQSIDKKTHNPTLLYFDQYTLDLESVREAAMKKSDKPQGHSLMELLNPTTEITNEANFLRYIAHGHMRLITPLLALIFALVSLCILLYGEINRRRRSYKILSIVLVACLFQFLTLGLINLSERLFATIPLTYILFFIVLGAAFSYLNEWAPFKRNNAQLKGQS